MSVTSLSKKVLLIYLTVLGLRSRGPSLVTERGALLAAAPSAEDRLRELQRAGRHPWLPGLEDRLSNCGAQPQLLHGTRDLPGSGIELMSPALAGGFSTSEPAGKPNTLCLDAF